MLDTPVLLACLRSEILKMNDGLAAQSGPKTLITAAAMLAVKAVIDAIESASKQSGDRTAIQHGKRNPEP